MAKLILKGDVADIELTTFEDEDGDNRALATCVRHPGRWAEGGCGWTEQYDDMNDAIEYAADHADTGRRY
jgi:hypothetical protein